MNASSTADRKGDILIVDDTINNIHLLSAMLSREGYEVRKAVNGQIAIVAAKALPPDLILLDINMPLMNGYQVCEQLKQIPETAHVPVIFLSALDDVLDKVKAFQMGGADYITKPFQCEEVLARIQNQLTIRRLQTQVETRNVELQQALSNLKVAQAQLVQKEKMTGLGQLTAGIAHEINNPISFIACNLNPAREYIRDLLHILKLYQRKYPEPDSELEAELEAVDLPFLTSDLENLMKSMQTGVDRIHSITLALRIFSRLGEADVKPVNLQESIDSVLLLLQHRLKVGEKRPEIQIVKVYAELPLVKCFASQINQVFLDLISNAIEALDGEMQTDPNPLLVTNPCIWVQTRLSASDKVQVSIRDNGIGIPAEVRSRMYEPFFTTKPVGKGAGLGLASCYQIVVEKHGGQLICNSDSDQGVEFVVELPLQSDHAETAELDPRNPEGAVKA